MFLEPFTDYEVLVKAFSGNIEGEFTQPLIVNTDNQGPSEPIISNITCYSQDTLYLEWLRPARVYGSIDYYYIFYRPQNQEGFTEQRIKEEKGHSLKDHKVC